MSPTFHTESSHIFEPMSGLYSVPSISPSVAIPELFHNSRFKSVLSLGGTPTLSTQSWALESHLLQLKFCFCHLL